MDVIDVDAVDVEKVDEIVPIARPRRPQLPPQSDLELDELTQPFVSIHDLFAEYNQKHFNNALKGTYVEYSTRMTLCAGTCTFKGPLGGCRIALSEPLLKFRPRSDLCSTLLHEMIHAYLFETEGLASRDGKDGHGPKFMSHAARINKAEKGRVSITPYHSFNEEVDLYRVHHWTCNLCGRVIKRAMNRAPAPRDPFWPLHEKTCGGAFIKTKEPEKKKKVKKRPPRNRAVAFDPNRNVQSQLPQGTMRTMRIDSLLKGKPKANSSVKRQPTTVDCPSCNKKVERDALNDHLDKCLTPGLFSQDGDNVVCIPPSDEEVEEIKQLSKKGPRETSNHDPIQERNADTKVESKRKGRSLKGDDILNSAKKRPRTTDDVLKEIIVDQDRLTSFAIDPMSMTAAEAKSLVKPLPLDSSHENLKKKKNPRVDILTGLKAIWQDEKPSPLQMQEKAFAEMRKHVASTSVVEISDEDEPTALPKQRLLQTKSVTPTVRVGSSSDHRKPKDTQKKEDSFTSPLHSLHIGGYETRDSKKIGQSSASVHHPRGNNAEGQHKVPKASVGDDVVVIDDEAPKNALSSPKRGTCPLCDASIAVEQLEQHVNDCLNAVAGAEQNAKVKKTHSPAKPVYGNCPVCNGRFPRNELEVHVNRCLNEDNVAPYFFTQTAQPGAKETEASEKQGNQVIDSASCPFCDVVMPRDKLQGHVSQCMVASGLGDAF